MGILEKTEAAGIVGCGGAGFPTHKKLTGNIEYLIINGAECEPLLRTDRYIMRNFAPRLVRAVSALKEELHIQHCVFALKHHYREEAEALKRAVSEAGADIRVHEMESFYPAGDEQTLVYEVTGRVVPPGGLPIMAGSVVDNVATILCIADAMEDTPFTHKYLTVTGEVAKPCVLRVPVGTSIRECIRLAGGALQERFFVVNGGPMMGRPIPPDALDDAVVTKTTSGILILPADGYHARSYELPVKAMLNRARSACIQCSYCSQLCPRHLLGHPLLPHRIMRKMAAGGDVRTMLDDPDVRNAALCCECGICEVYACPMGLQPRRINGLLKGELAAAGIRYQGNGETCSVSPDREPRKAPTERVAARAGVHRYYDYEITELLTADPERIELPLKMHIGAPAVPVVSAGQSVAAGSVVAKPAEGALGAAVHTGISGRVASVGERIVIIKE